MAKVVITIEDDSTGIDLMIEANPIFDLNCKNPETLTRAQRTAVAVVRGITESASASYEMERHPCMSPFPGVIDPASRKVN